MNIFKFVFILFPISLSLIPSQFDEQKFKNNSDIYGNKSANLMELIKLANDYEEIHGYSLQVPDMLPISHSEIVSFLGDSFDDILEVWHAFQKLQSKSFVGFVDNSNVWLDMIRSLIKAHFDKHKFTNEKLERFLLEHQNKLLMVRSTGKEDSQELSNAGGNESISSVRPVIGDINEAIKKVISSYFSEKSITQRLLGRDESLFDQDPFMPVLLQVMIGEDSKNIPTSGVIFSEEPQTNTKDLTLIQSTFGHNEAIVNGLLRPDSYLVYKDLIIPSIVKKLKRLTPSQDGLDWKNNSLSLAKSSSLRKEALLALKEVANMIQAYYGYPVDIEFVILDKIIYLVQARPLEVSIIDPYYIKNKYLETLALDDIHKDVNFIVQEGGQAKIVTDASQIIQSQTLREALLNKYLPHPNKKEIKIVLVKEMAPSTSHEATEFRKFGVMAMVSSSLSSNIKYPIIIDPQRGIWVPIKGEDKELLEKGWFHHPLRPTISLSDEWKGDISWPQKLDVNVKYKDLDLDKLLELLNKEDAFDDILHRIYLVLAKAIKDQKEREIATKQTSPNLVKQLKILSSNILNIIKYIKEDDGKKDLTRLFLISALESLLFANYDKEILNSQSILGLLRDQRIDDRLVEELELAGMPYRGHIALYGRIGDLALTDDLKNEYYKFLQDLAQKPKDIQARFGEMFYDLANLDLMSSWLNIIFYKNQDLWSLLKEYEDNKVYLTAINNFNQEIKNYNFAGFERVEGFDKRFKALKKMLTKWRSEGELFDSFDSQPKLAKLASLNAMRLLVEKFDLSIKALKGSPEYNDEIRRVERFKAMIKEYFSLMNDWLLLGDVRVKLERDLKRYISTTEYMLKIDNVISKAPIKKEQTIPNNSFNVSGSMLGSGANIYRSWGKDPTLENMFSLCHQNLLIILATLGKEIGIEDLPLPDLFAQAVKKAEEITISLRGIFLLGIQISKEELVYFYNMPLRNHSSTFSVHYNLKDKKIKIYFQFIGQARERWETYARLMFVLFPIFGIKSISGPNVDSDMGLLDFGVELLNMKQINDYFDILHIMGHNSLGNTENIIEPVKGLIDRLIKDEEVKKIIEIFVDNLLLADYPMNIDDVAMLLKTYPDIILKNPHVDKANMLLGAIETNRADLAELVIEKMQDIPLELASIRIGPFRDGILSTVFNKGMYGVFKLLLRKDPSLIKMDYYYNKILGETFLHRAARVGKKEIVELLLEKALWLATDEKYAKTNDGLTALDLAFKFGHLDIAKLLIEKAPNLLEISRISKEESYKKLKQ